MKMRQDRSTTMEPRRGIRMENGKTTKEECEREKNEEQIHQMSVKRCTQGTTQLRNEWNDTK